MVWADGAVARETLVAARLSRRWFLRRRFRIGNAWALIERDIYSGVWMRLRRVAGGGKLIARSAVSALLDAIRLSPRLTTSCGGVAEGLGMIVGAAGFAYETYGVDRPRLRRWNT